MARGCVSHCRECNGHFSGDTAFDRHRVGPPTERRCIDPTEDDWYEETIGVCSLGGDEPRDDVVVWRQRGAAE